MAADYIGGYPTIFAPGAFDRPKQRVEVQSWPGEDGDLLLLRGRHGAELTVASETPAANVVAAHQLLASYQAMQGADPKVVVFAGVNLASVWRVKYAVLECEPVEIGRVDAGIAPAEFGLFAGAFLSVRWRLWPVAF